MKKIRTWIIKLSLLINEIAFKYLVYSDPKAPIGIRDHARWFVEGISTRLFAWAYDGSDEETEDGIEFACDDVPERWLTRRQLEIKRRLCEFI